MEFQNARHTDYGVAATSAAFPKLLKIEGTPEAAFFYAQGGGETVIAGISDYNDNSGARRSPEASDREEWQHRSEQHH